MALSIRSRIRGIRWQFENAPLLSLSEYLSVLGLVTTALAAIISVVLSWGRVSTMNTSFTAAMTDAFTSSAVFVLCLVMEVGAFAVAVAYHFQSKNNSNHIPIKFALILSLVAFAITLVGVPLLLSVVENILFIIGIIVVCVFGFFILAGMLSGDGGGSASKSADGMSSKKETKGKSEEKFKGTTYTVDPKKLAVYNMSKYKHFDMCEGDWFVLVGAGMHGADNVKPLCTVNDYRKGKYRFVDTHGKEVRR